MDNFFKYFLFLILFIIITLIIYYIYSELKNKKTYYKYNKIKKWQRERLLSLLMNRIKSIQKSGKSINKDEKEILNLLIKNINQLEYWNDIEKLSNDSRSVSFVNVAIMDNLYLSPIDTVESKNRFLQNLFLLDCINGGVKYEGNKALCYPKNIDIKSTIQIIINNQEELTNNQKDILSGFVADAWKQRSPETYEEFKNEYIKNNHKKIVSDSAVQKTLEELINKKYLKDLSAPAKYVIYKIIIEILSNIIYSGNNYEPLSDNTKIYMRILANIIANESYETIYDKFTN